MMVKNVIWRIRERRGCENNDARNENMNSLNEPKSSSSQRHTHLQETTFRTPNRHIGVVHVTKHGGWIFVLLVKL